MAFSITPVGAGIVRSVPGLTLKRFLFYVVDKWKTLTKKLIGISTPGIIPASTIPLATGVHNS